MYPLSDSTAQLPVQDQQDLMAEADPWRHRIRVVAPASAHARHPAVSQRPRPSRLASIATSTRRRASTADLAVLLRARHVVAEATRAVGATLRWVADLPCDSRDRLRAKEQELAALGISWASDPDYDTALARDIEVTRQQRGAAGDLALGTGAAACPAAPLQAARGRRGIAPPRRGLAHTGMAGQV